LSGDHYIRDQRVEAAVGLLALVAAFVLLHDAYDGRGSKKPRLLGPVLPW
jgi:hypothetical protein